MATNFIKAGSTTKPWGVSGSPQRLQSPLGIGSIPVPSYSPTNPMLDLVSGFEEREKAALAANKAREKEIRGLYSGILNQDYSAARAAGQSEIARGERTSIGQGLQQLISSGLFGTTTAASVPAAAKRVSTEQRLKLEDVLQQRQTEAKKQFADFIERIEQPYPDYSMLMQAMAAAYS